MVLLLTMVGGYIDAQDYKVEETSVSLTSRRSLGSARRPSSASSAGTT